MNKFHAGWYLIYTKPRHEKTVHTYLTEININSYLPLTKKLRTWHDRKKFVNEPLFPSYVFIYLNSMHDYYEGIDAGGALYYVRSGKTIAKVSDSVVDNIKLIAGHSEDLEVSDTQFQPAEKLVIKEGALAGLSCEVVQFRNKTKLLVRVELLQRNILVSLPTEHLIRAEPGIA
ncbi:UpxY family transcription antiterminator [Flavitalea sp. BT771]|uniref:UpxY family transcription antiterminator n=1 Tax=Flavitalea sp. BT771 TaxID=3063329 RepID=UPI0026E30996|nr:UpxY family transcription antiterminator [Flavitalea sp. BT771]MDO6434627.1 UpxY family transcription antiterminator [Flavitalea sp. BT771]MDV6223527.1 UpxY family transcription antiterminator [Flavitalea sp. BT771]